MCRESGGASRWRRISWGLDQNDPSMTDRGFFPAEWGMISTDRWKKHPSLRPSYCFNDDTETEPGHPEKQRSAEPHVITVAQVSGCGVLVCGCCVQSLLVPILLAKRKKRKKICTQYICYLFWVRTYGSTFLGCWCPGLMTYGHMGKSKEWWDRHTAQLICKKSWNAPLWSQNVILVNPGADIWTDVVNIWTDFKSYILLPPPLPSPLFTFKCSKCKYTQKHLQIRQPSLSCLGWGCLHTTYILAFKRFSLWHASNVSSDKWCNVLLDHWGCFNKAQSFIKVARNIFFSN